MEAPEPDDARPLVHVVDSVDSSDAANDIIRGLDRLGVDASSPPPPATGLVRAVVVLLSAKAVHDPVWLRRVEQLRAERLVPVRVGDFEDGDVPDYLRELNWTFYRADDPEFLARLFTGINTDSARFRDERDTRALAERWEAEDRSPDFLIESRREVRRRVRLAAQSSHGGDPLIPPEQAVQLAGTFRQRREFLRDTFDDDDTVPRWVGGIVALWFALVRGLLDRALAEEAETPVAFLAASRAHATKVLRRRVVRTIIRTVLATATVTAIVATVLIVQDAVKRSTNAVAFTIGDVAQSGRPDLAAFKAGSSLLESPPEFSNDGRLRIAIEALSEHWQTGYVSVGGGYAIAATVPLEDGGILAVSYDGTLWQWGADLGAPASAPPPIPDAIAMDADPSGTTVVVTDGATIGVVLERGSPTTFTAPDGTTAVRLAPAVDHILVAARGALWVADLSGRTTQLGAWHEVIATAQTLDGRAVGLVRDGQELALVRDDGKMTALGSVPGSISAGSIAADGQSVAVVVDGTIWTSVDGAIASSGILTPGIVVAIAVTRNGLVIVSDRTRGVWIADPALGVPLGRICTGLGAAVSLFVARDDDQVMCLTASILSLDSIAELRPVALDATAPEPTTEVTSDGQVKRLAIVGDGLLRLDRADGTDFLTDSGGVSLDKNFVAPLDVDEVDFFATGAGVGAVGTPVTVAITDDGGTYAVGFSDGRLIEVDISSTGSIALVSTRQLPDHAAVMSISWSVDEREVTAITSSGTIWTLPSCAGCWGERLLFERIAERAWLCYAEADLAAMGDTVRNAFRLSSCESRGRVSG